MAKSKKMVIVESPAKAKTISRFLGSDYIVESCMGHIRDLPGSSKELPEEIKKKPWSHFAVDVDNDFQPFYCVPPDKKQVVKRIKEKMKFVNELILATDEDREGESISWHLIELLKPKVPIKRMVFHEITKPAIQQALKEFRKVDNNLVQAQEARRILDRLVGYSISPFLWKNVTRGLSAGRVQSVAMSLTSERELERLVFHKTTYWGIEAEHQKNKSVFKSRLLSHKGQRLVRSSDFDSTTGVLKNKSKEKTLLMPEKQAKELVESLKEKKFKVIKVDKKQISRNPPPPFITSTLQQECNRKLRLSSRQTMSLAQKLYEQGLITYMRTDSTFLSDQALKAARAEVTRLYGKDNLPPAARVYRKQAKGAQEAHEAIRPAGTRFVEPGKTKLSGPLLTVYELIWKRTLAGQMKNCIQNQVSIQLQTEQSVFTSSGVSVQFPGFYRLYEDERTDEVKLPDLKTGDEVSCLNLCAQSHETKPPARYTEASLIQKLEKEGVGRPSTYATIIGTIQDRGYVKKEKNQLIPTFTALVVNQLLKKYFPDYVDTQFTSEMEKHLDEIAKGKKDHIKYLKSVYFGDKGLKNLVEKQEKEKKQNQDRSLKLSGFDDYSFNVGPFGPYVSKKINDKKELSASLPANVYPGEVTMEMIEQLIQNKVKGGRSLGTDPKTGKKVWVILGRYGPYVKLDDEEALNTDKKKKKQLKSKMVSLHPFFEEDSIILEQALKLLELPKLLGTHPETKKEIKKGVGRFGPYIVHDGDFRSVPAEGFFDLDFKSAVNRLKEPKKSRKSGNILKELGKHPDSGQLISLMKGRYGHYIRHKTSNYSCPPDISLEKLDLAQALDIISGGDSKKKEKVGVRKSTSKNKKRKSG